VSATRLAYYDESPDLVPWSDAAVSAADVSKEVVMDVDIELVDPRDIDWEVWEPSYRINLWTPRGTPPAAWSCSTYEVTGADVEAVLAWTKSQVQDGMTFTILVVVRNGLDTLGVVRLAGEDPTRSNG
jgi:hypothetical protein